LQVQCPRLIVRRYADDPATLLAPDQHHSYDFAPISTFRIRVEQAQIRDEVLLVVSGQYGMGGRGIGDIGTRRRLLPEVRLGLSRS
jgi:hypothetical protein